MNVCILKKVFKSIVALFFLYLGLASLLALIVSMFNLWNSIVTGLWLWETRDVLAGLFFIALLGVCSLLESGKFFKLVMHEESLI